MQNQPQIQESELQSILLVEDDPALVSGLRYSMEKEGYRVRAAGSVKEGIAFFKAEPFSLVILDIGLPDGTGFDVCQAIRESSAVPVLFLTACDEEVNVVMGLDMGGDDYITKPFRLRELISRIKALLRRSRPPRNSGLIESGNLRLNTNECRLHKGDTEIFLTPVEYRLIQFLMSNPHKIMTRDLLLSKLWDSSCNSDFVDANTLTVYVRRLREKIEDNPSDPRWILTIRGIGYKWDADTIWGWEESSHENGNL